MGERIAQNPVLDGRYLILERIGAGGMGEVFRAFDRAEERSVALKVLRAEVPSNLPESLAEEFRAWASLRHPFIVRAHEFRRAREGPFPLETPYLVLEYVRGLPVHRALAPGAVPPNRLEELARRLLAALSHVHASGLVHRDLKPGNVLVGRSSGALGRVKLTDFGLAAPAGIRREPGRFSGSLPYMAPESVLGVPLDGRADLYALGILLHFLAAGRLPFDARDPEGVVRWHLECGGADPRARGAAIPERLARFVVRLTARLPADRPASATAALEILGAPRVAHASLPVAVRGARAMARLAFDLVRGGTSRWLPLPLSRDGRRAVVRDAGVLAQLHGFSVQELRPSARAGSSNLDRLVLRTLLESEAAARAWARRLGGERRLSLHLLGGLPMWDRLRGGAPDLASDADDRRRVARAVAALWRRIAAERGLLLVVEPGALRDPVAAEAVSAFREELDRVRPGAGAPRALVLAPPGDLRRPCERARTASARPGAGDRSPALRAAGSARG